MKAFLVPTILGFTGLVMLAAAETKMSEDAVLRALAAIQDAESRKDAPALLSHLADDFTLTAKRPDGSIRLQMSLQEYKAFTEELFTKAAVYEHRQGKITVEISPDGMSARARYETYQHEERADRGKLDWTNLETDTFVLRNGKVLLKSAETSFSAVTSRLSESDLAWSAISR